MSNPKFSTLTDEVKDGFIKQFKELESEFTKLGYEIFLYGGTLLGAIREGNLIPEDDDFDFCILLKGKTKIEVKNELQTINKHFKQNNMLCECTHFLGQAHYYTKAHDRHFDGWGAWVDKTDKVSTCFIIHEGENKQHTRLITKTDLLPLKIIILRGETFKIPFDSETFLVALYGENWRTPSDTKPIKPPVSVFFNGERIEKRDAYTQRELLLDLKYLLDKNNITFWLQSGTLLGAYRDKDFIKWDAKDIDIGLLDEDYWKVREILANSDFKYKWIWRREFAVYKGESVHPHIDLFFHDKDEYYSYCYSYAPNPINKVWNVEWRMKLENDLIFPLKQIEFLDDKFNVPNQLEKYLVQHYGENWKTPDDKWSFTKIPAQDDNYQAITGIVPTFMRPECIKKLIKSCREIYPKLPLIIGMQGQPFEIEPDENVTIVNLPDDCGLSFARNELVKAVKTPFTLLLDDDFVFTRETDIYRMLEVFGYSPEIGIVGGRLKFNGNIKSYEKYLIPLDDFLLGIDWNKLHQSKMVETYKINRTEFGISDIIYNFFLAKTDMLLQYPWDNRHKIHSEHLDFFLNLKLNSEVRVAFCPEIFINHEKIVTAPYNEFRNRSYYDLIYEKYGFVTGWTIGEKWKVNYKENKKELK